MEFRVLGPVEVVASGQSLDLGGPKQRTILALLVANAGRPMSADALIDGAYGDEAPDGARRTVQTYISNLRSKIGDTITSVPSGYQFNPVDSWVDAEQFVTDVETARDLIESDPTTASAALKEALALWRGLPFSDVEARGELESEITRLNELRLVALESRIDADLASGRDRELVGELEALTVEHPFRESFQSQHLLALYRSGRQAEALRAYTRMREHLAEELGVDPSPDLRHLEQRILEQDPTLALAPQSSVRRRAVLVIDLSGETIASVGDPDERRQILASVDRTVGRAIAEAGGTLAAQQATATYSTFEDVHTAIAAVDQISSTAPRLDGLPVVRVAIDIGQVEQEPSGAIAGPAVIRAAGLVATAHPGQVLMSSDAQAAAVSSVADGSDGLLLRVLGRYPIARLEEQQTVHQLVIDGLPTEFPPLRAGAEPPELPFTRAAVPGYELREEIGQGLFGTVYRGYQPSVGREVAIKVINAELANSAGFIRRFAVEAQMISRMEHPNVVPLYDFWRGPEAALLVMRLMRGGSLADWVAVNEMNRDLALRLVDQVGGALATAHALGIAHGDLQPSNVLLNEAGDFFLSDFGIAGDTPTLGGGMAQQLDVAAFASMVLGTVAPAALEEAEEAILDAGRRGEYTTAGDLLGVWRSAIGDAAASPTFTPTRNPYKGLAAFSELDAQDFHGRTQVTQELIAAVGANRLVAVVGPSGIGKSSVVRAGLLPALRNDAVPGSGEWLIADCVPGSHPFERLATSIMRVASAFPHDLEELLQKDDRGLLKTVDRYLPAGSQLLLVVDQFEELFTLTGDDETRDQFLRLLASTVTDEESNVRVLLTVRADFLDRPLRHPEFGELLRSGTVLVSAPTDADMREIIQRPASGVGVDFEPGLVERIVGEVHGEAGALPLVEFALTELFDQRESDLLTLGAYESTGGVTGALGRRAEDVLTTLDVGTKEVARQVFMRLVTPGEDGRDTRNRVRVSELTSLGVDVGLVQQILSAFGENRLLTFDHDEVTRGATVEVAHEALLREWPRLTGWLDEHREELILRGRLGVAVGDWVGSDRAEAYLLTGGRLAQHEVWTENAGLPLSTDEQDLLASSRRAEDERRASRRRVRRVIMGGFAAAAVVGVVLAGLALNSSRQAGESEREAITQAQDADAARIEALSSTSLAQARELVLEAEKATIDDPELGIHLAMQAIERFDEAGATPGAAVTALRRAITANRVAARLPGSLFVSTSPDGTVIAMGSDDGSVALLDARTFEPIGSIPVEGFSAYAWYSTDGSEIFPAVATNEGGILMWAIDTETGDRELLPGPSGGYFFDTDSYIDISGSGDVVYRREELLTVWGRETGAVLFDRPVAPFSGSGYAMDGRLAYVTLDEAGIPIVEVVNGKTGEPLNAVANNSFLPEFVRFSPDGRRIALTSANGWVGVIDLDTDGLAWPPIKFERARRPVWNSDGTRLATGGEHPLIIVDAVAGAEIRELPAGSGGSEIYEYIPGTDLVAVSTFGGDSLVLDVADASPESLVDLYSPIRALGMRVTPDGERIITREAWPGFATIDTRTGDTISLVEQLDPSPVTVDIGMTIPTSDGLFASSLDEDLLYKIWPTAGGVPIYTAERDWVIVGLNADASLAVLKKDQDPMARLVDTRDDRLIAELEVGPWLTFATFSPDGRHIIGSTETAPDSMIVWEASDGTFVSRFGGAADEYDGLWVRFVPPGDKVVVATRRGDILVYDFAALLGGTDTEDAIIATIPAHDSFVYEPAISPDGSLIATSSQSEAARVWDIASGTLLGEFGTDETQAVAFHPTEPWLYIFTGDTITAHTLDIDALIEIGQSSLTREMTEEECQQYLHESCSG
jgi:DNA-binding SARP family transcriptional activator/WD40 repeat protein/tRNA A-37 threonylcarbamoyl transferase component Bud32/type II secretory pathway predicted ATPase ExeA